MPAKLDRCVKSVKKTGKETGAAYAICSTSTGYVKQSKHKWIKKNVRLGK